MPTEFKVLKGTGKWVKLYLPDDSFGDSAWKLDLYLDEENLKAFKALRLMNKIKKDDDGTFIHLKRPTKKVFKGQEVIFAPPIVTDAKGNPFNEPIGNGSALTVTLEYYGFNPRTGGGPGHAVKIHAVQVDDLVPSPYAQSKEKANEERIAAISPSQEQQ